MMDIFNLLGKEPEETVTYPMITEEDVLNFHELLKINDSVEAFFEQTNSANTFFKAFPDIKKTIGVPKSAEVFYAHKLGYAYNQIPNKLVYVLSTVFKELDYKFPNLVIWKITKELQPYCTKSFVVGDTKYTVKDVIDNVYGKSSKLLSDVTYKVLNDDNVYEVYIENVNRVALLPKDIGDALSDEDCKKLEYNPKLGIVLGDMPVRRLNGRLGIVFDDFDLREGI